jgi:hypothetical protein
MDVLLSHQCRREITLGRSVAVCTHSLELHDIVSTRQGDQCRTVGMLLMRAQPEASRTLVLRIGGTIAPVVQLARFTSAFAHVA